MHGHRERKRLSRGVEFVAVVADLLDQTLSPVFVMPCFRANGGLKGKHSRPTPKGSA
jgi:hypothetical protein